MNLHKIKYFLEKMMEKSFKEIINSIFPKTCPICQLKPINNSHFCDICNNLLFNDYAPITSTINNYQTISLFEFNEEIQSIIHNLKYNNFPSPALELIDKTSDKLNLPQVDIICPVPIHWRRFLKRGYNQSTLLSNEISKKNKIEVKELLIRKRYTDTQTKKRKFDRAENLDNVIVAKKNLELKDKNILIVDDVLTTGATIKNCVKALEKYEIGKIYILTIAIVN